MSKAEEFAYSKYPKDKKGVLYDLARNSIIEGYHQAEKDNEQTWEDIDWIVGEAVCRVSEDGEAEQICKEVLKRFKDYKERKEKCQ